MTGSKKFDNLAAIFLLFSTLGTLGIFISIQFLLEKPLPNDEKEFKLLQKNVKEISKNEEYYLDKLVINLPSETSRARFLEVKTSLVPFKGIDIEDFEENKAVIQDSIIDIASRMPVQELSSISGKILLKSRIKKRINGIIRKVAVKKIYFTRFIVQ